jgi:hypothetical protein
MIEIKKKPQSEQYNFYFNEELFDEIEVWESKGNFGLRIHLDEFSKELLKLEPSHFKNIKEITVHEILEWLDTRFFGSYVEINFYKTSFDIENKSISLDFTYVIQLKSTDWSLPFSVNSYIERFVDIWKKKSSRYCDIQYGELYEEDEESYDIALTINYSVETFRKSILKEIKNAEPVIKECHEETINLLMKGSEHSFLVSFDFPDEVKIPCEQYLIYFAQFLKDLGIDAISNLKEEAGKVLFSVTPNEDIEALDKIREALEVYLRLPSSPITSNSQEIAIQRLESQVEYFRSQIRLARAENQLKEATIQQQQVTIMKLGENVMIESMVKPVSGKKTSEKVVKGVEVGKIEELEKYGVIIDLGELFRTMKGWFKKKS